MEGICAIDWIIIAQVSMRQKSEEHYNNKGAYIYTEKEFQVGYKKVKPKQCLRPALITNPVTLSRCCVFAIASRLSFPYEVTPCS